MRIYMTGLIGEAVHTKLENARTSAMGGTRDTQSFREILFSMMPELSQQVKPVGVSDTDSTSPVARADGSTLLYAITNADTDSTASAVVNALGIPVSSDNNIKAAADSLSSAITLLGSSEGADTSTVITRVADFVSRYNALLQDLRAGSSSSGFMYANLIKTSAQTAADALAGAGIAVDADGRLTFDEGKFSELGIDGFLSGISSAVSAVSTYADSITGSGTGLLDFLTEDDTSSYSTANYYGSVLNILA